MSALHTRAGQSGERVPRRDFGLDWLLLQRIYRLAKPYWVRHGAWRSWLVLGISCLLISAGVALGGWITFLSRDMTNALVAKDQSPFWAQFLLRSMAAAGRDILAIPTHFLRQLIALSSEQKGGEPGAAGRAADLPRKVAFGHRLIALRQDFAASVYVDLARAMLAQGDLPGAEQAFSRVDDNAGLSNVAALRAAAYAEVGRNCEALASYRLALQRDPDDVPTIVAASILRERQGQTGLAWEDDWRGLVGLLSRQPQLHDGLSEAAALDVAHYLPTLLEGVLLNWPDDGAVTVSDSGPGLDDEAHGSLFEPVVRRSAELGGYGLGLAIVKAVADLHGGTVRAGNREKGGAEFLISLHPVPAPG